MKYLSLVMAKVVRFASFHSMKSTQMSVTLTLFSFLCSTAGGQNSVLSLSPGSAIQAAIDALPDSGGVIALSPGTYRLTQSVLLRNNLTITGPRTAVILAAANFGAFTNKGSISNVVFDGFTLQKSGIALQNADHIVARNLYLVKTGSTAFNIQGDASNIEIMNNVCESPATYFCFSIGSSAAPNPADHDWMIVGNTMLDCASNCILVVAGKRVVIANNIVDGCGDTCIESGTGVQGASITGNVVDISGATTSTIVGISTRSNQYVTVSGNTVIGNPNPAYAQNCYLGWHGKDRGETQLEQYVIYVANQSSGCSVGLKLFQANHFTIGGNDYENNATSVSIDTSPGGATEGIELGSRGARAKLWSNQGRD